MALATGDQLGPYQILQPIGRGGMGTVYRARDTRMSRDVAIKVGDEVFSDRFNRELRAIAALNHPNICTLYDTGSTPEVPGYLVMELIQGDTLADRIAAGPIPEEEALRMAREIAEALEAAHEKGIVHRDLKPGNIKITPEGHVKVLDFGLAKVSPATPDPDTAETDVSLTFAGAIVGTAAYMSPEQASGKAVDRRADIWAFGAVLYEMLTARRPFAGDSTQETLAAILARDPDLDAVPATLRPLVEKCLRKALRRRWQWIGDVRLALEEGPDSAPTPAGALRSARLSWLVAAAGVALGLFGILRVAPEPAAAVRFSVPLPGGVASGAMVALSPDGRSLAFSAVEDGQFRLRVRSLDELEARLLPGADGARYPFWSPDGMELGYFAEGELRTVLADGGEPLTLAEVDATLLGGTWGREGVIVFSQARQLYKVSEKGGDPELVYSPESGILYNPVFLPDGRHFLFVNNLSGVYVGSLDGTPPEHVLSDPSVTVYSPDGYLLFVRQGRLMAQRFDAKRFTLSGEAVPVTREAVAMVLGVPALSAADGGAVAYAPLVPEQLHWVDRTGASTEELDVPRNWRNFRLSPDQGSLVFDFSSTQGAGSSYQVELLDMQRATRELLTPEGDGVVPLFSPDGTEVAYTSNRLGRYNPYVTSTSAPRQERLIRDMELEGGYPVDWSPDGANILWWGDEDLWVVPVDGSTPFTIAQSRFEERAGSFSPDGDWIAYSSNESSRYEIYLTPFPAEGGRRVTVSNQGGASPSWRSDGGELYYVGGDGRLTAVPVTFGEDGVQFGRAESLFPVGSSSFSRAYEPSLDGQRFLIAAPSETGEISFTWLLDWTRLLTE